eukprot:1154470-Pelagomonas_calceolata.AAC.1
MVKAKPHMLLASDNIKFIVCVYAQCELVNDLVVTGVELEHNHIGKLDVVARYGLFTAVLRQ